MRSELDDNGWLVGEAEPLDIASSFTILAPDAESLMHGERIRHQAKRFFALDVTLLTDKRYPGGGWPRTDAALFDVAGENIELITFPAEQHPDLMRIARAAGDHVGAGLDVLVRRTKRVWQLPGAVHEPAPLALAAVLASILLGPILPPGGEVVFGVKTARERLAALAWRP